jgi:hypothetical protein
MKLESEGRPAIQDPQSSDVLAAVSGLALPRHSFLILTRTPTSYVQVAMQADERFVIEYRDGGPPSLRSVREDFSRNEVAQHLESYLDGGDVWRDGIQWRPVDGMGPRDGWDTVSSGFAFLAVVVLLVAFFSMNAPREPGTSGTDPVESLAIATLVFLPSALIDMRRFGRMDAQKKFRTILALIGALIAVMYWIDRWT